jgi:hypothetical protein
MAGDRAAEHLHQTEAAKVDFDFSGLTPMAADDTGFDFSGLTTPADRRSLLAKGVDAATTPLLPQIATGAKAIADVIDRPREIRGGLLDALQGIPDIARGLTHDPGAVLKAGVAGVIEGTGNVAAQFTSPLDALLTVAGLKGVRGAAGAVGQTARAATRLGSGLLAARGAERAVTSDTPSEMGAGALQAVLGLAGLREPHGPATEPPPVIRGQLRAAPIRVTPAGEALLPGQEIAMTRTPDGSFVRAERGTYPDREIRGLLPARAEAAQELIADEAGAVARRGDLRHGEFDFSGLSSLEPTARPAAARDTSYVRAERGTDPSVDRGVEATAAPSHGGEDFGSVNPRLLSHLGGAAAGAAAGAASGDDQTSTGQRILHGVLGGLLGAAAVSAWPRGVITGRLLMGTPDAMGDHAPVGPTTTRPPEPPLTPHADPLAGTEPFVARFPEALRDGIRDVLARNEGFSAQRRGVITAEQTARLADGLTLDARARLAPGTALNAEGIRRFADGVATAQSNVQTLAAKVASGAATDADLVALESAKAEVTTLTASVMGARSEAGRSLAQFRLLARVLESGNPTLIREAADGLRGEQAQFAAAFTQLPDDPVTRYRWLQHQQQPGVMDQVRSVYYANILSGLKTHERNFIGNLSNIATSLVAHPVTAALDAATHAVTGRPRTVFFDELPSQAAGALAGVQQGFDQALFALKHGVSRQALSGAIRAAEAGKLDVPRVEFAGGAANPFNVPGRLLDASDQFFRAIARSVELYGGAHAQARQEGLTGTRLQDRMAELVTGGDGVAQRIQAAADRAAQRAVFQEKGGPIASAFSTAVRRLPALSFVVPFVRTPSNILKQGLELTPAGFGMAAAREAGRAGVQAQGRAAAGTLAMGALAYLAATGQLTGSGPSDPSARAQLMESGWRPNALKIGDHYISTSVFQPISVPASIVANAFEAWRARGANQDEASPAVARALADAWQAAAKSGRSLLDQSFLSGVSDLFEALANPDRPVAERTVAGVLHGLTPLSGAQRTIADALDPRIRDPRGVSEQILAHVPGVSARVPSKDDRFGRELLRSGGTITSAIDPFNTSTTVHDPVLAELGRLHLSMGYPSGEMAGVDLDRAQQRAVTRAKGTTTYRLLEQAIGSTRYQELSDAQKSAVLDALIERSRSAVGRVLRGRLVAR